MNIEHHEFEVEVLRIARSLWPDNEFSGSQMELGRERDGIFETEDCIHIIEATTSRKKEKAQNDIRKIEQLALRWQKKQSFKKTSAP